MARRVNRRRDGRRPGEMRPVRIDLHPLPHAEGSVQIAAGGTRVICAATVELGVPPFLRGKGEGWVTAEYGMLPRSSPERIPRESARGRPAGRTQEIQRLIGRSLRAVVDRRRLGERTVILDCDVVQADGGTRTLSITGAYLALALALAKLRRAGEVPQGVLLDSVAAASAGIVEGRLLLDLDYPEDSAASVDMNIVMTGRGRIVEVQGTAEGSPFTREDLHGLLSLGERGIRKLARLQRKVLRQALAERAP
ncbi:MAG: ribonuclease PH [Candidatus Tectomicrobia bacterium]|nr:ribonuclease PH [Candidatus Tectomicrobia bacterium]